MATVGITGTPKSSLIFFTSSLYFFFASSNILRAMTILSVSSINSVRRYRFLSKFVASITSTTTSGSSSKMKFLVITSSREYAVREYVPGKSTMVIFFPSKVIVPSFFSTVTPGQFPMC